MKMDVPLSNEDIERALRGENGFRGVYSYDLSAPFCQTACSWYW